jgi:putative membrane protein
MKQFDWSKPQRQPLAGLAIVFLNTFWEVLKRLWPFLLLMLLGNNKEGKVNRYEIIALLFLVFTIISAVLRFIFFKFYIEENKLIIKKGWLKKETKAIPLERIQTVHIEQGPAHQLLNIVKLSIDTAGTQKAEATIDALPKSMAEALRIQLLSEKREEASEETKVKLREPIVRLSGKDLLKLSISANHLEAFFILLSFGYGLYANLKDIDNNLFSGLQDFLPQRAIYPVLFLIISILLITILVSTGIIFFRFYDFVVFQTSKGFQIKSGLTNVKERLIAFQKIQFVSWKSNPLRKLLGLWMLEYHIAGGDEAKRKLKVQLPVTQERYIALLANGYYSLPLISDQIAVRIHASFITRRLLVLGLLPSVIIIPLLWYVWNEYALLFLFYPLLIMIVSWCTQKKFRLWAMDDVLYIKKGIFGEERILMQWHKLQTVQIKQSIFQRRKELATVVIHTAGGIITLPFFTLQAARQVVNFALYKTESVDKDWL